MVDPTTGIMADTTTTGQNRERQTHALGVKLLTESMLVSRGDHTTRRASFGTSTLGNKRWR